MTSNRTAHLGTDVLYWVYTQAAGFIVLYGKWRPQGFDEVVGQDHIIVTLRNALATDQVAHAYLFSGPRGTGKTTTARILARAVNCPNLRDGDPCNDCPACIAIANGSALDLIEMDAASNRGIDDVRELREKIAFAPSDLRRKVYLLDEVHMLTDGAFNALLKTIEEPPPHAIFILATTELHKVPATIISRCQRYDFHRVPNTAIIERLSYIASREKFTFSGESLDEIATQSRGGLRDAITLLEQVVAQYGPEPTHDDVLLALGLIHDERTERLADALVEEDLANALEISRDVADSGIDIARFTRATIEELRRRQIAAVRDSNSSPQLVRSLSTSIAELAKADFRLDPASPVPLEVACASAIFGGAPAVVVAPIEAGVAQGARRPAPQGQGGRPAAQGAGGGGDAKAAAVASDPEDRFLRDLRMRLQMVNVKASAYLNGSCHVIGINDETIELGFYHQVHMNQIGNDFRALVEDQASEILGRPVRLTLQLVERSGPAAGKAAGPRGGHLSEAAKAMGGRLVGKDA